MFPEGLLHTLNRSNVLSMKPPGRHLDTCTLVKRRTLYGDDGGRTASATTCKALTGKSLLRGGRGGTPQGGSPLQGDANCGSEVARLTWLS